MSEILTLDELQKIAGKNSRLKGFRAEGDFLRSMVEKTKNGDSITASRHETNLRNYYANRLMLISGEIAEAHEQLRKGRGVTEQYTSEGGKPEGVPSELADILIRLLDFVDEIGHDLSAEEFDFEAVTLHKMAFNALRPAMHGGKKF